MKNNIDILIEVLYYTQWERQLIPAGPEEGKRMETILIMAEAIAKASFLEILRLDIQYNRIDNEMYALCVLGSLSFEKTEVEYIIHENGVVQKRGEGVC